MGRVGRLQVTPLITISLHPLLTPPASVTQQLSGGVPGRTAEMEDHASLRISVV